MTTSIRSRSIVGAALVGASLAWPLAGGASAGPVEPEVPAAIAVEEGNKVFLVGHAEGVQIYSCNGTSWVFVAPRADLYGDNGQLLTTHGAGPSWEANDGSVVTATRVDGVTVDATAIPWLLLRATSASTGGRLSRTTFIQRINTTGGLAPPAAQCTAATAGTGQEVPYTADYYFWKATGQP